VSVLQRKELEDSPLADLHAIASELGIEGYRALRRGDLVGAILRAQGSEDEDSGVELEAGDVERNPQEVELEATEAEAEAAEEIADETDVDLEGSTDPSPVPDAALVEAGIHPDALDEDEVAPITSPEEAPEGDIVGGTLDILANGSGFLRVDGQGQSNEDVYVSPAQIRRCELRAGDEVSGPVRAPRRSERHPSLVHVGTVNGRDAEPPEERPQFSELTPVHPTERLPAPAALDSVPFGKGSRVAISGGPGAGATRLLHEIVTKLAGVDATLMLVLVGARPEEVTDWAREEGIAVSGGSFDLPLEAQIQAAELAVERAKRAVERGADAVVVIDSLESLPPGPMRRIFGAGRKVEEGGSVTVIAAVGASSDALRQASTRITLDDTAEEPTVLTPLSGTQRADLLG
jgi:transcription termination factor Rho